MSDTIKPKMPWFFLKAELAVVVCMLCILVMKLVTADVDSTKARENPTNFNELHSVPLPNKEKINDNTTKSESETFGLVTGICYSRDKASAVINNKTIVYEGDTIDGVTIVKIHKDKVEFTKNGKNWALKIIRFP